MVFALNTRPAGMERITTLELADVFIGEAVEAVRARVGDGKVLLALSGGVDSSVVAALLIKAIGKQLISVHVNHGLMRKGESEEVIDVFDKGMDANLVYVDAADRFLDLLAGVEEPETKRKIIGNEFVRVFAEEAIRKTCLVTGMLLTSVIGVAAFVPTAGMALTLMSISYFGSAFTIVTIWCLPGDFVPTSTVGVLGGTQNFFSNIGSALNPIVIGAIYGATGAFGLPLALSGGVCIVGALVFAFMLPRVEQIDFSRELKGA